MAVNIIKKYSGNPKLSQKRRPYKYQLDYKLNGKRKRETIKEVIFLPTDSRDVRKQKDRVVNNIKAKLEIDLANQSSGLISRDLNKASFINFFQSILETKTPNTKGTWDNTLKHIIAFHGEKLRFVDISENWLENFKNYLLENVSQNSARTYLQKVSTALNLAVKKKIIFENPLKFIDRPKLEEQEMVYLTEDEVRQIIATDFYDNQVKNAFLFGCYTGLRFSDLKRLKWQNIRGNTIQLTQKKTKASIYIPLNNNAKGILASQKKTSEKIFNLSNHNRSCNRTLEKLIKKTTIDKKVTFHSSRHTFATLLITSGANIFTVSKLLGHKDIKSTLVYAKVINEEKERAINSMPEFNI
ncbi:tyrosine-type recombinase/integrase [Zobellia russellii]|uniref:tyrosine-type recombinase/integrase n=1 Tax=Zobellia russellii TaxID=248907 RepID=UPI0037DD4177